MTQHVKLKGQRWEFEDGNHRIIVENAVHMPSLYSQERIRVDGETIRDRELVGSVSGNVLPDWTTVFETEWLTREGEKRLSIQWRSGMTKIRARVLLDGEELPWTDYFSAKWTGEKGQWPSEPD